MPQQNSPTKKKTQHQNMGTKKLSSVTYDDLSVCNITHTCHFFFCLEPPKVTNVKRPETCGK